MGVWLVAAQPVALHAQQPAPPFPSVSGALFQESGGWLGVSIEEVMADKAKELKLPGVYGVLVAQVGGDSPAAKAGLKNGDVITEYNGQRVEGAMQFRRLVRETPPGHTAQLSVWRDGRSQKLSAEVGNAPAGQDFLPNFGGRPFENLAPPADPGGRGPRSFGFQAPVPGIRRTPDGAPTLGISGQDLTGQLGNYFGVPDGEGVLVSSVRQGSAAEKAGVQAGDVITKINGDRVRNLMELRDKLRDQRSAQSVTLSVLRKGSEVSIKVEPDKSQPQPFGPARGIPL